MSYDIYLCDPVSGDVLQLDDAHQMRGGTYALGGTTRCAFNVTYNYAPHFYRTMGENGIRTIYGMTGAESLPLLRSAADQLGDETGDDYWKPTEGNAKRALLSLAALASLRPDGKWQGD